MNTKYSLLILSISVLIFGCGKSTETTVVKSKTGLLPGQTTTPVASINQPSTEDDFTHLNVGEIGTIESLDPLFAQNNSELRAIHLVYDGLTRLSENGSIAPALASKWEVSPDSLRYTFHLRTNVYYHNSSKFSSGLGRRLSAKDVEKNFLRMGSVLVPDMAAKKFQSILGFENYTREQSTVKNPSKRIIHTIEGLKVQDDSTLTITLSRKDSNLLYNLAHPHASIYAEESIPKEGGPIMEPIGTGAFYFAKKEPSKLIFASNNDYYREISIPDRLDIFYGLNEDQLLKNLTSRELNALIELGPKTILSSTDSLGNLNTNYASNYKLEKESATAKYQLYYNAESNQPNARDFVASLTSVFDANKDRLGSISSMATKNLATVTQRVDVSKLSVKVTHTINPFEEYLVNGLASKFVANGATFSLNASYALNKDVAFSLVPHGEEAPVLTWKVPVHILKEKDHQGISISSTPWNISFNGFSSAMKDSQ